jgi:hypothetical protein
MAKPFHAIQRSGKDFKVVAKHSGKTLGKHGSRAGALAQLKAVEWSMHGGSDKGGK